MEQGLKGGGGKYMVDNIYQKAYMYNAMNIEAQTLFSALSNDIRLRCLMLLQLQGEQQVLRLRRVSMNLLWMIIITELRLK